MRGRLICPFICEIVRLDTAATEAADGYDHVFKVPKPKLDAGGAYTNERREKIAIKVPCQVEVGSFDQQRMTPSGNDSDGRMTFVLHFRDLERLGLVDPTTGDALIRINDRIVNVYDKRTGALVQKLPGDGVHVTEAQPTFGLGSRRNLLVLTCSSRPASVTG